MQTNLFDENEPSSDIWTVGQLTKKIKYLLENQFQPFWIKGEISNLRVQPSGHRYFIIKDSISQIKAVYFKGDSNGSNYVPSDGDECIAYGNLTVYEPRGDYQFRVKYLMQEGTGLLKHKFDKLKEKFLAEGLFDKDRKKTLPNLAKRIAVVTSIKGAAVQDFLSILKKRNWSGEITIFPSLVQGLNAPDDIIKSIKKIEELKQHDLIIVTRGGGSTEDLWSFNDELLVRTLADCKIPTISAVGHQTDFVLTDFVADYRAETPSAAAEWITTKFISLKEDIQNFQAKIENVGKEFFIRKTEKLNLLNAQLFSFEPSSKLSSLDQYLDDIRFKKDSIIKTFFTHIKFQLETLDRRLESNSIKSVLNRGFTFVKSNDGKIIERSKNIEINQKIQVVFKDGEKEFISG